MFLHLISSRAESPIGDSRPVERAIEARNGSEDGQGSMVRCLHFAHTYIANRKFSNILIHRFIGNFFSYYEISRFQTNSMCCHFSPNNFCNIMGRNQHRPSVDISFKYTEYRRKKKER